MSNWYRIKATTPDHAKAIQKTLLDQKYPAWRYGNPKRVNYVVTMIGEAHFHWLSNLAKTHGGTATEIPFPPSSVRGAVKMATSNGRNHNGTIATNKLPPLSSALEQQAQVQVTFPEVLAQLESYRDDLWRKVEQLDCLIVNLKEWNETGESVHELLQKHQENILQARQIFEQYATHSLEEAWGEGFSFASAGANHADPSPR